MGSQRCRWYDRKSQYDYSGSDRFGTYIRVCVYTTVQTDRRRGFERCITCEKETFVHKTKHLLEFSNYSTVYVLTFQPKKTQLILIKLFPFEVVRPVFNVVNLKTQLYRSRTTSGCCHPGKDPRLEEQCRFRTSVH